MKALHLGDLEKQVMDIIWDCDNCSTRDILNRLYNDKVLAYTTIATVLQRLYEKGLVTRRADTSGYIYKAKLTKEKYSASVAKSFLINFINSYGDTGIASFANSIDKLPLKKRNYFLKLLEDNDKSK